MQTDDGEMTPEEQQRWLASYRESMARAKERNDALAPRHRGRWVANRSAHRFLLVLASGAELPAIARNEKALRQHFPDARDVRFVSRGDRHG